MVTQIIALAYHAKVHGRYMLTNDGFIHFRYMRTMLLSLSRISRGHAACCQLPSA